MRARNSDLGVIRYYFGSEIVGYVVRGEPNSQCVFSDIFISGSMM